MHAALTSIGLQSQARSQARNFQVSLSQICDPQNCEINWLSSAAKFWGNLLLGSGHRDVEYEIEHCNGEVDPLGGIAVLQVVPQGGGSGVLSMMGDSVFNVLSVLSQHESAGLLLSE